LYSLVERCGDDPFTGVSGGIETGKLIIEICEVYLGDTARWIKRKQTM